MRDFFRLLNARGEEQVQCEPSPSPSQHPHTVPVPAYAATDGVVPRLANSDAFVPWRKPSAAYTLEHERRNVAMNWSVHARFNDASRRAFVRDGQFDVALPRLRAILVLCDIKWFVTAMPSIRDLVDRDMTSGAGWSTPSRAGPLQRKRAAILGIVLFSVNYTYP